MKRRKLAVLACVALISGLLALGAASAPAFHEGDRVLMFSDTFTWTDPASGGQVIMNENVYEGCIVDGVLAPHDMTWEYVVENRTYDPVPGVTNGFSGFQLRFPGPVPELYNQQSPTVGGPWQQNAFSGVFPPFGAEWDVRLPNPGIMPTETGTFSFCTFERIDVTVTSSGAGQGPAGWGHTWGLGIGEPIIDADGTATAGDGLPGAVQVIPLDPLASFPVTGATTAGLDWFDNDNDGQWTFGFAGDDLHSEDPATCATAIRDGNHDLGLDCKILDFDGSLFNGQQVNCDLEVNFAFTPPHTFPNGGCPSSINNIRYHDADVDGSWDDGEDIVWDTNGDSVFGSVINAQTFIFHGNQSVPGVELFALELDMCSPGHEVCKKVKYLDGDMDGVIEVGEFVEFFEVIQVHNDSGETWTDVTVTDRWGAEIEIGDTAVTHGSVTLTTKGKSDKVFLEWDVGDLADGETASLVLKTHSDLDPGGAQEYTEPGTYEYNSGAVLKFLNEEGRKRSFETGSVLLTVTP